MIKTAKASEVREVAKKLLEPIATEVREEMSSIRTEINESIRAHNRAIDALDDTNQKTKELIKLQGKVDHDHAQLISEFLNLKQSVTQRMTMVGNLLARVVNLEGEIVKLRQRQNRIAEVQAQRENRGE